MALPCSGEIGHAAIHQELYGNHPGPGDNVSLRSLSDTIGLRTPDAESEFYCYETPPALTIYVTDGNNAIWRTLDGGANWTKQTGETSVGSYAWQTQISKWGARVVRSQNWTSSKAAQISFNSGDTFTNGSTNTNPQTAAGLAWNGTYWYYCGNGFAYRGTSSTSVTALNVGVSDITSIAVANSSYVFTVHNNATGVRRSSNNGAYWSSPGSVSYASSIACSESGAKVYAGGDSKIWKSSNYGANFSLVQFPFNGQVGMDIACSADGTHVLLRGSTKAWISTDSCATYTEITSSVGGVSGNRSHGSRNVSYSGENMMMITGDDTLKVSADYGITWSTVPTGLSTIKTGSIEPGEVISDPPVAEFYANETSPDTTDIVRFYDTSTNTPTSWAWTFTPSTVTYTTGSSTSQNPRVRFDAVGKYDVKLVATNSIGSDTKWRLEYINVKAYVPPPTAAFHASSTAIEVYDTVQLLDDSTGNANSWSWTIYPATGQSYKWEQGSNSFSQNPYISFSNSGKAGVNLKVSNNGGSNSEYKPEYIDVSHNLLTGLLSFWEYTSGSLDDSHGNNDGTGVGSIGSDPNGIVGQSIHFDGDSGKIEILGADDFGNQTFSVSFWAKWAGASSDSYAVLMSELNSVKTGWEIRYSTGLFIVNFWNNNSIIDSHAISYTLPTSWVHIVMILDQSDKLYFIVNTDIKMQDTPFTAYFGSTMNMGGWDNGLVNIFNGSIDEVGYWGRALTTEDIKLLYNNGAGNQYPFT